MRHVTLTDCDFVTLVLAATAFVLCLYMEIGA